MDEDQDRIYVGSKDHILSLNINNISQDPLSVCIYSENPRFPYCMHFFFRQKMCIYQFASGRSPDPHLTELLALVLCVMQDEQAAPQPLFSTVNLF